MQAAFIFALHCATYVLAIWRAVEQPRQIEYCDYSSDFMIAVVDPFCTSSIRDSSQRVPVGAGIGLHGPLVCLCIVTEPSRQTVPLYHVIYTI